MNKEATPIMTDTFAILGTGRMGGAFAARLSALGYTTLLASRDPESERVKELCEGLSNCTAVNLEDAKRADIIVFAIPYSAFSTLTKSLGGLEGKIILDCTNALKMSEDGLMC